MKKIAIAFAVATVAAAVAVCSPVRSMLGADGSATGGYEMPTAADYVQSGLVVQWDAIENVGYGVHDSTSTVWVDLCGNAPNVVLRTSSQSWTDNSIEVGKDYYCLRTVSISDDLFLTLQSAMKRADITVEMVFADSESNPSSQVYSGNTPLGLLRSDYPSRLFYVSRGGICLNPFNSGYGYYINEIPVDDTARNYYAFTLNGIVDEYHIASGIWCNDYASVRTLPTNNSNLYVWESLVETLYKDKAIIVFPGRNAISMSVNAIRIYSRALSPAEIRYNYLVDRERFNLP